MGSFPKIPQTPQAFPPPFPKLNCTMSCKRNVKRNVTVGGKVFRYKNDLIEYVREQIRNDDLDQDFFLELMNHHPNRRTDLYDRSGLPRRFHVGKNAAYCFKGKALCIEGNEEPISWHRAVNMIFAKDVKVQNKKHDVKYAIQSMRHEVHFGDGAKLRDFLRERDGKHCALCGTDKNLQADHHPTRFEDIVGGFLEERKLSYADIGRMPKKNASFDKSGTIHFFASKPFREDWLTYHDAKAKFRWLCKSCNIRGNRGIKKRKRK